MSDATDLPWPRCLGTFDEESCRYFLHEVGSRTVPRYPFSFGMEEVYGSILGRYGREGIPDATGLLQELLEDDQNATGLGDDGDVWRSWRHGWRHRNDDSLNPFIPHVGAFVLPPPTSPHIRWLKATNFAMNWQYDCDDTLRVKERIIDPSGHSFVVLNAEDSTPKQRTIASTEPLVLMPGKPAEHCRTSKRVSVTSIDTNLSTLFTAPGFVHEGSRQSDIGVSDHELMVPDARQRAARLVTRRNKFPRRSDTKSVRFSEQSFILKDPAQESGGVSGVLVHERAYHSPSEHQSAATVGNITEEVDDRFGGASGGRSVSSPVVQETSQTHPQEQPTPIPEHHRRAVNREARLIDGTIFTSRARKTKIIVEAQADAALESVADSKRSSLRHSWSPNRRDSLRYNIKNEIRHLFHREKEHKTAFEDAKHSSVPAQHRTSITRHRPSMSTRNKPQNSSPPATVAVASSSLLGLDGTAEVPNSCKSLVDLNKPLPLSPADIVRSMSIRSHLTTSQYSGTASNPKSAASTESSLSHTSSKKGFKELASGVLQQNMMSSHDLPSISEIETGHKRIPEPQKTPVTATTPDFYASISQANPFRDIDRPNSPPRPPPLNFSTPQRQQHGASTQSRPPRSEATEGPLLPPKPGSPCRHVPVQNMDVKETIERGRSSDVPHPVTPSKKEDLAPRTPTKRSRSPIKRFLGLAKSSSASKGDTQETPPQATGQDASAKKDSLKKWSNRLRYGFLTPDQEQLRQEELIEDHTHESSSSTPQNSTFPVSLEPPLQAKVQSEVELILSVTANRYLMHEAKAGRISAESVAKTKDLWEKMNRPQVVEFHYDSITQHNLVMANLARVKLHGDSATDAIAINSTMRGWKILANEMAVRTFCSPDSVLRKHLHDAHRVLELLGAPLVTFLAYEDMQLKTLSTISSRQKERMDRRTGSQSRNPSGSSGILQLHRRNFSEGSNHYDYLGYPSTALQMDKIRISPSPKPFPKPKSRKATAGDGAIMSLPTNFERTRDGYHNTRPGKPARKFQGDHDRGVQL